MSDTLSRLMQALAAATNEDQRRLLREALATILNAPAAPERPYSISWKDAARK
jgi:predicted transcriptional regulator